MVDSPEAESYGTHRRAIGLPYEAGRLLSVLVQKIPGWGALCILPLAISQCFLHASNLPVRPGYNPPHCMIYTPFKGDEFFNTSDRIVMGLQWNLGRAAEIMSRDRGKVRSHRRLVTHESLWFHGPPHLPSVLSSTFFFFQAPSFLIRSIVEFFIFSLEMGRL